MISEAEKATFNNSGYLKLEGVLNQQNASRMRDALLRICEREGFWKEGCWKTSGQQSISRLKRRLKKSGALGDFMTPDLHKATLQLMNGSSVQPMFAKNHLLFSLPRGVGSNNDLDWHMDIPLLGDTSIPGIQLFTFIDSVGPREGGTVAVAGSHRLGKSQQANSKEFRIQLERTEFFGQLFSSEPSEPSHIFDAEGTVDGIELKVIEMCGEPGDVIFMDVRLWHTRFPNFSERSRMMLTQRFLPEHVRRQVKNRYYG